MRPGSLFWSRTLVPSLEYRSQEGQLASDCVNGTVSPKNSSINGSRTLSRALRRESSHSWREQT